MSWLSSLLGLDAQHNAGVAQSNATQEQALQNQYGAIGANVYAGLEGSGVNQENAYSQNYLQLLNDYAGISGLGSNLISAPRGGAASPTGGAITPQPQGNLSGQLNGTPQNPAAAPKPGAGNFTGTGWAGTRLTPTQITHGMGSGQLDPNSTPGQSPNGNNQANNPYGLDQYQSQQLNQTNANIANQGKSAVAAFQQQMSAQGITDPRAMELGQQQIQQHFSALQAEAQTSFFEQVKKDKQAALQQIMAGLQGYGQLGVSQQEAAGSGYLGLSSGAQAASNAQQNFSLQQQGIADQKTQGLLELIGFGVGGGFNTGGGGGGVRGGGEGTNATNDLPRSGANPLGGNGVPL